MPKKGRATTHEAPKPQLKKKDRYADRLSVLASELDAQKASLQLTLEQQHQGLERQKVLVDFVYGQEEIKRLLQYHDGLLQENPPAATPEATSPPEGLVSGNNRFNCLLAAAKPQDIKQVQTMQAEDWTRLATEIFQKQVVLLELADRGLFSVPAISSEGSFSGVTAALAGSMESLSVIATNAAAAAASAEREDHKTTPAGDVNAAADPDVSDHGLSALQQLERLVEYEVYITGLALLHNPAPYYLSASCNHLTGQIQQAPPQQVQNVLSRLRLSDLQLLHLRIAIEEFERLSRHTQQDGVQLSEQIANLSLQQLVDGVTQQQYEQHQEPLITDDSTAGASTTKEHQGSEKQSCADPCSTFASAIAASAAEAGTDSIAARETVRQKMEAHMDRYLARMNMHTCVTAWFIANTLTLRQLAIVTVASFPFYPNFHAVAEAAKQLHEQRQQERIARTASGATEDDEEALEKAESDASEPQQAAEQQQQEMDVSELQLAAFDKEVTEHMERRSPVLQQQLQRWWQDIGAQP